MKMMPWVVPVLVVATSSMLLSCTPAGPITAAQPAAPAAHDNKAVASPSQEEPVKPQHECVTGQRSQYYVVDTARLEGEPSAHLNWCFTAGYRGVGCPDDWQITRVLGHGLSNRERAGCDAIMRRMERRQAAQEARKKRLDEAYDKEHGLTPAK